MSLDDFKKDLDENKKESNRADFFKLKDGENRILILTNPVGYSEVFNIGIAYEGCGYGHLASRRYKCYVKDFRDDKIKIANFSYTVGQKIATLSEGVRTKFDSFPMPYVVDLKTEKAGTKEVNTEVLAMEDYILSTEDENELSSYDSIDDILSRLKNAQKKKVESDAVLQQKIRDKIQESGEQKPKETVPTVQIGSNELDTIEYPTDEINAEDIPF